MAGVDAHIPYPRVQAAIVAGDLSFLRRHSAQITLSMRDAIRVCLLIADQQPAQLDAASVRWIKQWAARAREEPRSDYRLIVEAFDRLPIAPEQSAAELEALCAARSLE